MHEPPAYADSGILRESGEAGSDLPEARANGHAGVRDIKWLRHRGISFDLICSVETKEESKRFFLKKEAQTF
jgi:hypothetical protein